MPSPVGHFLGGVIFGAAVGGASEPGRRDAASSGRRSWPSSGGPRRVMAVWVERVGSGVGWRQLAGLGLLGTLADLDFLFGSHSTYSHSIGAVALIGLVATWSPRGSLRWGMTCATAYGSHVLFDWLGTDGVAPFGVMALWPLDDRHYLAGLEWFSAIHRELWRDDFWSHNLWAVARECALLGPVAALVLWRRGRPPRR